MIRIAVALTGMILLASCATAPQVTPAARSELAPTGKLRVGINYFVKEKLDALAGLKQGLVESADKLPGSRVLDGRFSVVNQAIGTPRGRNTGAKHLAGFVEDAKLSGLVARTIEKNGVCGVTVAPPAQPTSTLQIGGGMS